LSNIWSPTVLKSGGAKEEKALAVWLNSSLGLLLALLYRVPTMGPWVQFKKPNLGALPVINVNDLGSARLSSLAAVYDRVAELEVLPYSQLSSDSVRRMMDDGLERAFGFTGIEAVERLLGREPVVCDLPLVAKPRMTKPGKSEDVSDLFDESSEDA
jgi:hypothetical protein